MGVPAGASKADRSTTVPSSVKGKRSKRPISEEAQIMPKLGTPRSLVSLISTGSPSPCQRQKAPGLATATFIPSYRLVPPQTMSLISPPMSVLHTRSLSALG